MLTMVTAKRPTPKKVPAASNPRKKGLVPVLVRMEPGQAKALRLAAIKRATARLREGKSGKPDASELVREAIAAWLERNR